MTWSSGLFSIVGMNPALVVPSVDLFQYLVHPDDQMNFDDGLGLSSDKRLRSSRFRIIRPDGSMRWLVNRAQPHFDRHGHAMLMIGVIQDVTDEEELRGGLDKESKLARILTELLGGWVWRAYPDGKFIETAEWTRLTGQTPQQAQDWDKLSAIHPDDRDDFRNAWRTAIAAGQKFSVRVRVMTTAGDYVRLIGRGLPLRNRNGEIEQWIGHCLYVENRAADDTDRRPLEPRHVRCARALLDWTAQDLAERSAVSFSTIRRMEQSTEAIRPESLHKVRQAFEAHGVTFARDGDGGLMIGLKSAAAKI